MKYISRFFLIALMFISCSSDDGGNSKPEPDPYILNAIIGSWAYDTVLINGTLINYQHTEGCTKDLFQFYNEEGKIFEFEEDYVSNCDICADCAITSTNLQWELYGDIIYLYFGEQFITEYEILEVNPDIIRYKRIFDYDEDGIDDEIEISGIPYDPYNEFDN